MNDRRLTGMRRELLTLVGLYVMAAVVTRAAEAAGIGRPCCCAPDCWCQRPGLGPFRWVVPAAHHRFVDSAEKRAKEHS